MKKTVALVCLFLIGFAAPFEQAVYAQAPLQKAYCSECECSPCHCATVSCMPPGATLCPPVKKRRRGITWREVGVVVTALIAGAAIILTAGDGGTS